MVGKIPIVVPSFNRWDIMNTHNVCADVKVCIPEGQLEKYKEVAPDVEYVTHPDDLIGLALKRQWICDKFDTVFMLDDDVKEFLYLGSAPKAPRVRYSPEDVRDIIQGIYEAALEVPMKVHLFGINHNNDTRTYHGNIPVGFTGYIVGASMGVIDWKDSNLYFDRRMNISTDYWISLLNAYYNRIIYKDRRWSLQCMPLAKTKGGNDIYRSLEKEKEAFKILKENFGHAIKSKPTSNFRKITAKGGTSTSEQHEFMRIMALPFKSNP